MVRSLTCVAVVQNSRFVSRSDDWELYSTEIQDKSPEQIKEYATVFKKKWKTLAEHPRIAARISEGEAKRNKRDNLEQLLANKIASVRYPMQELELNYPTTKGKVYSEEEDRYLLVRLNHYGMRADDVYERIKKDITEFPVFRFDWFFKSRSPQELQRRCNTLLGMIEKEAEARIQEEVKTKGTKGKVCDCCSLPLLGWREFLWACVDALFVETRDRGGQGGREREGLCCFNSCELDGWWSFEEESQKEENIRLFSLLIGVFPVATLDYCIHMAICF